MSKEVAEIIKQFGLIKHPEGGYYRETWRSESVMETVTLPAFTENAKRRLMTSILFLIPGDTYSSLHRIRGEEIWNYHDGDATIIFEIKEGTWKETILGKDDNQVLQHVISPGTWFGSRCINPEGYSLCGCTVVPGFEFDDFELGKQSKLIQEYPELSENITAFTRLP